MKGAREGGEDELATYREEARKAAQAVIAHPGTMRAAKVSQVGILAPPKKKGREGSL